VRGLLESHPWRAKLAAALALSGLFGAGLAFAGTTTVSLTAAGPQPGTVTVQWGDTVSFANASGGSPVVTIPRATVASPAIPPGGSWAYAFDGRSGNYVFRQTGGQRDFGGTVVVQLNGRVTMTARPETVTFGGRVAFRGTALAGFPVKLEQQSAGQGGQWTEQLTVPAAADGAWSASVVPQIGSRYRASAAADQLRSQTVFVRVRPRITVTVPRRAVAGRLVTVRARIAPAGAATSADLELYEPARRRWARVERRRVARSGLVSFRWRVPKGRSRLRVELFRTGLTNGFEPATGRPVSVIGT
jgi:hypothetical protein